MRQIDAVLMIGNIFEEIIGTILKFLMMTKKKEHKEPFNEKPIDNSEIAPEFMNTEDNVDTGKSENPDETATETTEEPAGKETAEKGKKIEEIEKKLAEMNDKYLRLSAEFDNYRKRTLREKMEMIRTASESVMQNILPIIDDFERAIKSMNSGMEYDATKEGILLIYNKFNDFITQNGIKEIDAIGSDFNTDLHEAVTKVPAQSDEMKGKIIDVIQKGYLLNDKVIRFAKVVVGE
jgi:molecular chaperone GrpE